MNCDNYLSMLATLPIGELLYGDAQAHAATCRDCARVTRVVAERERNMVVAFDALQTPVSGGPIAGRVLELARRRRIALYYRIVLAGATLATLLFLFLSRRTRPASTARVSETFRLQCLSPEQATEVLRPIRSPGVSISIHPTSPLGVITVDAPSAEMEALRAVLERYDSPTVSQCRVQAPVPSLIRNPQ